MKGDLYKRVLQFAGLFQTELAGLIGEPVSRLMRERIGSGQALEETRENRSSLRRAIAQLKYSYVSYAPTVSDRAATTSFHAPRPPFSETGAAAASALSGHSSSLHCDRSLLRLREHSRQRERIMSP